METIKSKSVTAFAPASIGNLAVGFDILGLALEQLGDEVHLVQRADQKIVIKEITGSSELPVKAEENTAGAALIYLQQNCGLASGFDVFIKKGIPVSSGLGGSAASAVAAAVAGNEFLPTPLAKMKLLPACLAGEKVASQSHHLDNIAPSLLGGLCLCLASKENPVVQLPFPDEVTCVLIHPALKIETKMARSILQNKIFLTQHIQQSQNLAGFITACFTDNLNLLRHSLVDLIAEPQRSHLIPGFDDLKSLVKSLDGALGFSISGAGPAMFALARNSTVAENIKDQCLQLLRERQLPAQAWCLKPDRAGAQVTQRAL